MVFYPGCLPLPVNDNKYIPVNTYNESLLMFELAVKFGNILAGLSKFLEEEIENV